MELQHPYQQFQQNVFHSRPVPAETPHLYYEYGLHLPQTPQQIYPKIFVYSNPFRDLDSLLNTIIESEVNPEGSMIYPWEDWYTFGLEADNFIRNAEDTPRVIKEREVLAEIEGVFFTVVDDYFKKNNVDLNLVQLSLSIFLYLKNYCLFLL